MKPDDVVLKKVAADNADAPGWELRESEIHGRGLFAARPIIAGERVIEYVGNRITKAESTRRALAWEEKARRSGEGLVYIFDLNKRYDLDGNIDNNPAKYINHSCEPNCEAVNIRGRIWIIALKDLKAGTELSFDYGYEMEHFMDHPCRCGAKKCVGYIVRSDLRPKLKRLLKKKNTQTTLRT